MAREKFPSDDVDRLMVRFPAGMRDRLKAAADENKRSMNAEIIARLEASLNYLQMREVSEEDLERQAMMRRYEKDVHDRDQFQSRLDRISQDIKKMEEAMLNAGIQLPRK